MLVRSYLSSVSYTFPSQDMPRNMPVKCCFQLVISLEIDKINGKLAVLLHLRACIKLYIGNDYYFYLTVTKNQWTTESSFTCLFAGILLIKEY